MGADVRVVVCFFFLAFKGHPDLEELKGEGFLPS